VDPRATLASRVATVFQARPENREPRERRAKTENLELRETRAKTPRNPSAERDPVDHQVRALNFSKPKKISFLGESGPEGPQGDQGPTGPAGKVWREIFENG
jgi:hypothetical protein